MPDFNLIVGCFCKFTFLRDSSLKRKGDCHVSCQRCFYISLTVKGSCVMVRVREKTRKFCTCRSFQNKNSFLFKFEMLRFSPLRFGFRGDSRARNSQFFVCQDLRLIHL